MPGAYFSKQSPFQEEKPQGALRLVGVPANGFVSTGVPKQGASFQTGRHASGTPEGTRTPYLLLRRQLLYPDELLAHLERVMGIEPTPTAWKAVVLAVILHPRFSRFYISHRILSQISALVKAFFRIFRSFLKIRHLRAIFDSCTGRNAPCFFGRSVRRRHGAEAGREDAPFRGRNACPAAWGRSVFSGKFPAAYTEDTPRTASKARRTGRSTSRFPPRPAARTQTAKRSPSS